ncbi:Txe/YoeB family addiction module toxin [Salmonella enterica subsp. enterica serovar Reading]|nr:Txe/YoeB family addiction module toxin [Salmonella enterica]EBP2212658.1 Txe/YoeB family addiction module toxin [Salmonella enterica]EBP7109898.1 Txe/YoeB family addiction module toxin [Salmonella enterica]EBW8773026.1 Txe/YoeB family addiction module toxin [Salmonella enterica subsp. enterica serovar Reading]
MVSRSQYERRNELIKDTRRTPFEGKDKPEPLKHHLSGFWSRRITEEHRLVYAATDDSLLIAACRYHY